MLNMLISWSACTIWCLLIPSHLDCLPLRSSTILVPLPNSFSGTFERWLTLCRFQLALQPRLEHAQQAFTHVYPVPGRCLKWFCTALSAFYQVVSLSSRFYGVYKCACVQLTKPLLVLRTICDFGGAAPILWCHKSVFPLWFTLVHSP